MAGQKQARSSGSGQRRDASQRGASQRGASQRGGNQRSGSQGARGQGTGSQRGPGQRGGPPAPGQPPGGPGRAPGTATTPGGQAAAGQAAQAPPGKFAAPVWLQITTQVLSLLGLAASIYLVIAHLTTASVLACPDKGFINCANVTTSAESKLFGVFPVSELGLAFYVFMVAINSPWGWRSKLAAVYWVRLGSVIIGMIFVLWLLYAELVLIKNLCVYCTSVHVITFLLFTLLVFHASGQPTRAAADQLYRQKG